jgi:hypothetical protein
MGGKLVKAQVVLGTLLVSACVSKAPNSGNALSSGAQSNSACSRIIEVPDTSGGFGSGVFSRRTVDVEKKSWSGKDLAGRACQLTIDDSKMTRDQYQALDLTFQLAEPFRIGGPLSNPTGPHSIHNIQDADMMIADEANIRNSEKVKEVMTRLGYDPHLSLMNEKIMSFSALLGPTAIIAPFTPNLRMIHVGVDVASCKPRYFAVSSSVPSEMMSDICVID